MHFRLEIDTLTSEIGEPHGNCTTSDCSAPRDYRVTVENDGQALHRGSCHSHVFDVANTLCDELGLAVQLNIDRNHDAQ